MEEGYAATRSSSGNVKTNFFERFKGPAGKTKKLNGRG